jgi:hypothetical protein
MIDPTVVDAAVEALVAGYVRHVDWASAPRPAYTLIFAWYYDGEAAEQLVIAPVVLGEERRRKALRANSVWDLWSAAEDIEPRAELDQGAMSSDPDVMGPVRALDAALKDADDWTTFAEVFRRVAAALTRYDWSDTALVPTDDFVALAWSMDNTGALESFVQSLPAERLAQWRLWGWLGDEPDPWAPDPTNEILVALDGAAVLRDRDGRLRQGRGDRFSREIAPHEHTLIQMGRGWAAGGLLPPGAVRAVIADPGALVAHANGAWLARWREPSRPAPPAVRYETADAEVVPTPWPGAREPLADEHLPCPACGMPEWERVIDDRRVVCARCGFAAGMERDAGALHTMTVARTSLADPGRDVADVLAEADEQRRAENAAVLARWPHGLWRLATPDDATPQLVGWSGGDDQPTALTLRQGVVSIDIAQSDFPPDPVCEVRSALASRGRGDRSVVAADAHQRWVAAQMAATDDHEIAVMLDGRPVPARLVAAADVWLIVLAPMPAVQIRVHGSGPIPPEPTLVAVAPGDVA